MLKLAETTLEQWQHAQPKESVSSELREPCREGAEKWVRPEENMLKVNVDGAVFEQEAKSGYGFVVRDCQGRMIRAGCGSYPGVVAPEVAKAIGI